MIAKIYIETTRTVIQYRDAPPVIDEPVYPGNDQEEHDSLNTGYITHGNVYIQLYDNYGNSVQGNYAQVTYREYFGDNTPSADKLVSIPGSVWPIQNNITLTDTTTGYHYRAEIVGAVSPNNGSYIPPDTSDATIQTIRIDSEESAAGAHNGQATVIATSTYLPLQYSLDGQHFQSEPTFYNLMGGGYTAYVKDAIATTLASQTFNMPTKSSLLIADPTVTLPNGNVSRWNAAFNPIVFIYQRRDFAITDIAPEISTNKLRLTLNHVLSGLKPKDKVFVQAGSINNRYAYQGIYDVISVNLNTLVLDVPYTNPGAITGFVNANAERPYYNIKTEISYQDKLTSQVQTIEATHRPDRSGIVRAELSSFLQSLLRAKDESDFSQINFRDDNLSACYLIRYAEVWQDLQTGEDITPSYTSIDMPYYVTYLAKQLGDIYGSNIADYVPFKKNTSASDRAKWMTDFAEPAYSNGYPFDIGFIYSEDIAGLDVYCEITPLDINRSPLPGSVRTSYLLNEDRSFLLTQDGSRLVIARQPMISKPIVQPIAQHIGLNRLLINTRFADEVYYFTLALKYNDSEGSHTLTQTQTIRVDDAVDDQSVYLRWIGLTGSWNYYRFVYNQEVTLDVQNAVIIKNHVSDWANQDGIDEVISKSAGLKMKVMAEDLSVADIKGLQSLKYSPKVQMLASRNPAKWQTIVLNTATFNEYETRNRQAPFSVTFNLPALNVQAQ